MRYPHDEIRHAGFGIFGKKTAEVSFALHLAGDT